MEGLVGRGYRGGRVERRLNRRRFFEEDPKGGRVREWEEDCIAFSKSWKRKIL
jgi:hypothetical protein